VNRIAELPVLNTKPIADVLRRIAPFIPDDASHARAYSSRVDHSLRNRASDDIRLLKNRLKTVGEQALFVSKFN
jgi:hypothetical protein